MKTARALWNEFVLWLKTDWRLHFWLGISAVVVSLYLALSANDSSLFGRSGALMTITGAIMTYRAFFRGREDTFLRDTGRADRRRIFAVERVDFQRRSENGRRKAFRRGLISFVAGTLIWSYGDFLLPKKQPRKTVDVSTHE